MVLVLLVLVAYFVFAAGCVPLLSVDADCAVRRLYFLVMIGIHASRTQRAFVFPGGIYRQRYRYSRGSVL